MVVLAIVAVVALLVGMALASGFLVPRQNASSSSAPAATVTTVVRGESASVVLDSSGGWVADDSAGTVRRFDPASGAWWSRPIPVGRAVVALAGGGGRVWAASALSNTVVSIDSATGRVARTPVGVAPEPVSVATGAGGIWVASLGAGTVSLINPATGEVTASVALPDGAVRLAVGDGAVWVTGQSDTLTRIDPKPVGLTLRWRSVVVGQGPIGVAVGDGAVWVANALSSTVSEVDPAHLRVLRTIPTGASDPASVAAWRGLVWVGGGQSPVVTAFDPATGGQVGGRVTIGGVVRQLVVGDGSLWAATANAGSVVRFSR